MSEIIDIYLDTNFIYHFLLPIPECKQAIFGFFQQIKERKISAYTCVNTFDELSYRLLLAAVKDKYGVNPIEFIRDQKQVAMNAFYPDLVKVLIMLRSIPNMNILPLTTNELSRMIQELTSINLLPRDALPLAVMRNHGICFIASDDRDFDGIKSVERIWMYNPPLA